METAARQVEINQKISKALHLLEEASSQEKALLTSKISQTAGQVKDDLYVIGQNTANEIRTRAKYVDQTVHERPWQAMGVAAIVGLAAGALFMRKN